MRFLLAFLTVFAVSPALAQDDGGRFDLGGDAFIAGQSVTLSDEGRDDAFLAGERVELRAGISGSAHMAGRWVTADAPVGSDLYAAGQSVTVTGSVAGDATVAGQEIAVRDAVGGDLRAFGSEIRLTGSVAGSMIVGGEFVILNATVSGDAALAVRELEFGPDAVIEGTLILYEEEPGALSVPSRVASEDRIERREIEEWDEDWGDYGPVGPRAIIGGFLMGVLAVTLAAAAIAAFAPETMARFRKRVLSEPLTALATGFVAQSALIGAGILLGMTVIGLLLTPAAIFLAILAGFAGYVVGAYAFGVGILHATGRHDPENTGERALAAGVGALAAGLIGLIPLLGWIFVLGLTLAGAGAVTLVLLRPRLFADA